MSIYKKAAEMIKHSGRISAFTGAGISVESGIPPFRGDDGLWSKYDPALLDILNPVYTVQQGGLTAATAADNTDDLALLDLQVDPFQDLQIAKRFMYIAYFYHETIFPSTRLPYRESG